MEEKDKEEYLKMLSTNGEFDHTVYDPGKQILSSTLDVVTLGIKPLIEAIIGTNYITGEELSDTERKWKAVEGTIGLVTIGGVGIGAKIAGAGAKEIASPVD